MMDNLYNPDNSIEIPSPVQDFFKYRNTLYFRKLPWHWRESTVDLSESLHTGICGNNRGCNCLIGLLVGFWLQARTTFL